jgi:hypothetical protein
MRRIPKVLAFVGLVVALYWLRIVIDVEPACRHAQMIRSWWWCG